MIQDQNFKLGIIGDLIERGLKISEYHQADQGNCFYDFAPVLVLKYAKSIFETAEEQAKLKQLQQEFKTINDLSRISGDDELEFWEYLSEHLFNDSNDDYRAQIVTAWAVQYQFAPEILAQTTMIDIEVFNLGFELARPDWGGETDDFVIKTLEGINIFPNLKTLNINRSLISDEDDLAAQTICDRFGIKLDIFG
jgi:hypothetical protein